MGKLEELVSQLKETAYEMNADTLTAKIIDRPDGHTLVIIWARTEDDIPEGI